MATRYAVANGNWSALATWDGGASVPASGDYVYANSYTVTLNVNFNIGVGTISTELNPITGLAGGSFLQSASINITCNVQGGTTYCINSNTNGITLIVYGNVIGGTGAGAAGILGRTSTYNVIGTVTGGTGSLAAGISTTTYSSTNNITGNVNSGIGASGILATGINSVVNVTGDITTNTAYTAISTQTCYATGLITGSTNVAAISCTTFYLNGNIINKGNKNAVVCTNIYIEPSSVTYWTMQDDLGNNYTMYSANNFTTFPSESDVRSGVSFGAGIYNGTLIVPLPSLVAKGVPTDATVGTLEMTPADFWTYASRTLTCGSGITAADVWDYLTTGTVVSDSVLEWILNRLSSITAQSELSTYDTSKGTSVKSDIQQSTSTIVDEINKTATTQPIEKKSRPYKW